MMRAHILTLALAATVSMPCLPAVAQSEAHGMRGDGNGQQAPPENVRGTVTAIAADGITVRTLEGETWQVKTGANTRVSHEREPAKLTDLKPGDGVMAFGQIDSADPKMLRAVFVGYETAAEVKERMATFGKTWIAGRVTAKDGATLTLDVHMPGDAGPAKKQTITADENTSFKRGGESITLADIHPGDMVMGGGQVKDGQFVPASLNVMAPHGHGHGGPPPPGVNAGAAQPPQGKPAPESSAPQQ